VDEAFARLFDDAMLSAPGGRIERRSAVARSASSFAEMRRPVTFVPQIPIDVGDRLSQRSHTAGDAESENSVTRRAARRNWRASSAGRANSATGRMGELAFAAM